jgi:hypothetical protein
MVWCPLELIPALFICILTDDGPRLWRARRSRDVARLTAERPSWHEQVAAAVAPALQPDDVRRALRDTPAAESATMEARGATHTVSEAAAQVGGLQRRKQVAIRDLQGFGLGGSRTGRFRDARRFPSTRW